MENKKRKERIAGLDVIRGLAVTLVLVNHSLIYNSTSPSLKTFGFNCGYYGVSIFFVLSGFLITRILIKEIELTGTVSIYIFFWKRALRLFPALWFYLIFLSGLKLMGFLPGHPWHGLLTAILYARNYIGSGHETGHLWSLSVEEHFYLIWPFLFLAISKSKKKLAVVTLGQERVQLSLKAT